MAKRFIVIPAPIVLKNPDGNGIAKDAGGVDLPAVTFADFIKKCLFADPRWMSDFAGINARESVVAALAESSDLISLAEEDWRYLEGSVRAPQHVAFVMGAQQRQPGFGGAWSLPAMSQFLTFMRAIVDAKTTKPELPISVDSVEAEAGVTSPASKH